MSSASFWKRQLATWPIHIRQRENQVFLILTLLIGAVVGLTVVAFIVLTERLGVRMYPPGSAAWRRVLVPGGPKQLAELLDARSSLPHVHADHSLDLALERMGAGGLDVLPVVSRANVRGLEGIVSLSDILKAYGIGGPRSPAPGRSEGA